MESVCPLICGEFVKGHDVIHSQVIKGPTYLARIVVPSLDEGPYLVPLPTP